MNRSKKTCTKCFVPACSNTTTNSRNKLFVYVKEVLRRKWCEEVNAEYKPERRLLCCEDHLNLAEDLENYIKVKLMNARPVLKSSAKLRLINLPSCIKIEASAPQVSLTLKSLLMQPAEVELKKTELKKQRETTESNCAKTSPSAVSASTHGMNAVISSRSFRWFAICPSQKLNLISDTIEWCNYTGSVFLFQKLTGSIPG